MAGRKPTQGKRAQPQPSFIRASAHLRYDLSEADRSFVEATNGAGRRLAVMGAVMAILRFLISPEVIFPSRSATHLSLLNQFGARFAGRQTIKPGVRETFEAFCRSRLQGDWGPAPSRRRWCCLGCGDMLALPGGVETVWEADEDAVLWVTTGEPTHAFEGVCPEVGARALIEPTLFSADAIARELRTLYEPPMKPETPGRALFMATERTEELGTCLPSMKLTLNAVRPRRGAAPAPAQCCSDRTFAARGKMRIHDSGKTFRWTQYVTLLTPAGAEHDHRNEQIHDAITAGDIALALIVQDGGIYYYARTMGFVFA